MLRDFTKQELDSMPIFNTKKDIEDWLSIMHKKIEQEQHKVSYIPSIYTEETHKQNKNFLESSSIYLKYANLESNKVEKEWELLEQEKALKSQPKLYSTSELKILEDAKEQRRKVAREIEKDFIRSIPKGRHDQTLKNTHDAFQALNNARAEMEEIYPPDGISNYEWLIDQKTKAEGLRFLILDWRSGNSVDKVMKRNQMTVQLNHITKQEFEEYIKTQTRPMPPKHLNIELHKDA